MQTVGNLPQNADSVAERTREIPAQAAAARTSRSAHTLRKLSGSVNGTPPTPPPAARPTFFEGTYRADSREGSKRPAFNPLFSLPRWRYLYNATLVALDALMMLVSCAFMFLVRPDVLGTVNQLIPGGVLTTLAIFCGTWILALAFTSSYRRHTMGEGYALYAKVASAMFIELVALCSIAYFFDLGFPRWLVCIASIASGALTLIERWLMRRALHSNRRKGEFNYPTVIVGSPEGIHETIDKLTTQIGLAIGYAPIAVCSVAQTSEGIDPDAAQYLVSVPFTPRNDFEKSLRVLPLNSRLPQTAKRLGAQTVLITDVFTRDSETLRTLSLAVESLCMELAVTAAVADIGGGRIHVRNNTALPIMSASLPQYSLPTRFMKRAIDTPVP